MRIVHAIRTTRLEYGGPARAAMDLVEALSTAGHDVTLLTACDDGVPDDWRERPNRIRVVKTWPGERGFVTRSGLRAATEAIASADIVHVHEIWELFNCQLASIARGSRIPYCVTCHGSLDRWSMAQKPRRKRTFHALASGRMLRHAAFIHCTAETEMRESREWLSDRPVVVLPPIVDVSPFRTLPGPQSARSALGITPGDRVLLYLSRLQPGKGVRQIIDSLPYVLAEEPDALLVVAGSGSPEFGDGLRRQAADLGVANRVRFVGFLAGEIRTSMIEAAKLFLLPSSHENFGIALFEAAACGCPLLVTPGVATADLLCDSGAAVSVPQDAQAIAKAALEHLEMPDQDWRTRSDRIRRWAMDYLAPDRVVREYEAAYRAHGRRHAPNNP
jgi:glycosyltransferase involved in cell wall biosynthesis